MTFASRLLAAILSARRLNTPQYEQAPSELLDLLFTISSRLYPKSFSNEKTSRVRSSDRDSSRADSRASFL